MHFSMKAASCPPAMSSNDPPVRAAFAVLIDYTVDRAVVKDCNDGRGVGIPQLFGNIRQGNIVFCRCERQIVGSAPSPTNVRLMQ